jgi:hypothetical protein
MNRLLSGLLDRAEALSAGELEYRSWERVAYVLKHLEFVEAPDNGGSRAVWNEAKNIRTIHAIWVQEKWNTVTEVTEPAHAECWEYETPGAQYGSYVGELPGWTEEDVGVSK